MAAAAQPKAAKSRSRSADRRLEVLRTAARVFADLGFRQATLEDVADALNMTRPALYYYANSKDELLRQCGDVANEIIHGALDQALLKPNGYEQFGTFAREYLVAICDDPGRCFALTDLREIADADRADHIKSRRSLTESVMAIIERGQADGSILPCDPRGVTRMMFASLNAVARWYRADGKKSPREIGQEIVDVLGWGVSGKTRPAA
jgi:AcrR family transcriptional regulator